MIFINNSSFVAFDFCTNIDDNWAYKIIGKI